MLVIVVHVGCVIVRVHRSVVGVTMRVLAHDGRIVHVIVMAVVVAMRVFVIAAVVGVFVPVFLRDDAGRHRRGHLSTVANPWS